MKISDKRRRALVGMSAAALACLSVACTRAPPSLDDWNAALVQVIPATPAKALADDASLSEACVEVRNDEPCVPVEILREPFDRLRVVRPRGQVPQGEDRPRLLPYISIRDGHLPRLTVDAHYPVSATTTTLPGGGTLKHGANRPRIAIVLDGDLAYETPNSDTPLGPVLFMPNKQQSERLKRIGPATAVQARLYYTPGGEYKETPLPLAPVDARRFASEFHALVKVYDALYRALEPQFNIDSVAQGDSIYGGRDLGSLQWSE